MQFALITPAGRILQFFTHTAAAIWQAAYGGVVISQQCLQDQQVLAQAAELEIYAEFG